MTFSSCPSGDKAIESTLPYYRHWSHSCDLTWGQQWSTRSDCLTALWPGMICHYRAMISYLQAAVVRQIMGDIERTQCKETCLKLKLQHCSLLTLAWTINLSFSHINKLLILFLSKVGEKYHISCFKKIIIVLTSKLLEALIIFQYWEYKWKIKETYTVSTSGSLR